MVGNLTRDIELRYTQSSLAVANTAIATSRKYNSSNGERKEEVCFVDITFFGRSAEIANQYLRKGSKILVEGRLVFDQWTDQQTGQKRSKHSVTVDTMQMLDSKSDSQQAYQGGNYGAPQTGGYQPPMQNSAPQQPSYGDSSGYQAPTQQQDQYNQPSTQPQGGYNPPPTQKMPENPLPEIDIDEDEIPF